MRTENLQSQQRIQGFTPTATLPVILFSNIPKTGQNWNYKFLVVMHRYGQLQKGEKIGGDLLTSIIMLKTLPRSLWEDRMCYISTYFGCTICS